MRNLDHADYISALRDDPRQLVKIERPREDTAVVAMTKPLMRGAADMSRHQTIMVEEFAEPNTFTTRYHQETIEALLNKEIKAAAD